ncbi:MAG: DUF3857 domain-containing protein [Acidobacteria bacterium]|nr:DUF3857 domain-containing protein [Acidobacteriota bacterium]
MKRILVSVFFLAMAARLLAGNAPTDFEKNLKPDPVKGYEDAVILLETGEVDNTYTREMSKTKILKRIKIFTRKGIEDYGTVKLSFDPQDENIGDIQATVWTPDGKKHVLDEKDIHKKKVSREWGMKETEISFALPGLESGSIAEYAYYHTYNGAQEINTWYSQHPIYCFRSEVTFIPWPGWRWGYVGGNLHAQPEVEHKKKSARGQYIHFTMKNIPALPKEDYSLPYNSRREYIVVYYMDVNWKFNNYWIERGNRYYNHTLKKMLKPCGATKKLVKTELAGLSPETAVEKIHDYVIEHYTPISTMSKDDFSKVEDKYWKKLAHVSTVSKMMKLPYLWDRQLNFIEGALIHTALPDAQIAYVFYCPWNDRLFKKDLHTLNQFSGSMLRVTYKGKTHYLEPSKRLLPADTVEYGAKGVPLLILDPKNGTRIMKIAADKPNANVTKVDIDVTLGEDNLRFHLVKQMNQYNSYDLRKTLYFFNDKEKKDVLEGRLKKQYGDKVKVVSQKVINLKDIHKPLILDMEFTVPFELAEAGDQIFFKPVGLSRYLTNPFNAEQRHSSIVFKYPGIVDQKVVYHLSDDFSIASLPKNETIKLFYFGYRMSFSKQDDHTFTVNTKENMDRNMFNATSDRMFKNYFDRVISVSHPTFVLKESE